MQELYTSIALVQSGQVGPFHLTNVTSFPFFEARVFWESKRIHHAHLLRLPGKEKVGKEAIHLPQSSPDVFKLRIL